MTAVYLVPKKEVAQALKEKGCEELESPVDEHSAWRSPWGKAFFVPQCGDEGRTPDWQLRKILDEIDASKPACN